MGRDYDCRVRNACSVSCVFCVFSRREECAHLSGFSVVRHANPACRYHGHFPRFFGNLYCSSPSMQVMTPLTDLGTAWHYVFCTRLRGRSSALGAHQRSRRSAEVLHRLLHPAHDLERRCGCVTEYRITARIPAARWRFRILRSRGFRRHH